MSDELHEVPALQWAYAALAVMTKDETIYQTCRPVWWAQES